MRIEEKQIGPVTVLRFDGDFDARTLPRANQAVDALFEAMRFRIVFDVSGIEVATSTAVGFLAGAARRSQNYGGKVVLCHPSKLLLDTVRILKFDSLFEHRDSEEEAVALAAAE